MKQKLAKLQPRASDNCNFKMRFYAFADQDKRITKSIETKNDELADIIQNDMQWLMGKRYEADSLQLDHIHETPYKLFYGHEKIFSSNPLESSDEELEIKTDDDDVQWILLKKYTQMQQISHNELQAERKKRKHYQEELRVLRADHKTLKGNVHAKEIILESLMPSNYDLLKKYEKKQEHTHDRKQNLKTVSDMMTFLDNKEISQITTEDIEMALDDYMENGIKSARVNDINVTFNNRLKKMGYFFDDLEKKYKLPNPLKNIDKKKISKKKEIVYYTEESRDKMIRNIGLTHGIYWQALVGTLTYMGFSASTLRGFRLKDIIQVPNAKTGKKARHLNACHHDFRRLKTDNRVRDIEIPEKLLLILDEYLESDFLDKTDDENYLFPAQGYSLSKVHQMWTTSGLSKQLNGEKGKEGILPKRVNCLDIRRSYGSLLIRSGYKLHEVATLMGNTMQMVEKHYGWMTASEISHK